MFNQTTVLYAENVYAGVSRYRITRDSLVEFIAKPRVLALRCYQNDREEAKKHIPLWRFGEPILNPKPFASDPKLIMKTCDNVRINTILCLDFDSELSMDDYRTQNEAYTYYMYTTSGYGYKPGDRYRVLMPLAVPVPNDMLMAAMPCEVSSAYTSLYQMVASQFDWWRHLDASAARNWQCIPAILEHGSPYKYDVHETDKCIDLGCENLSAEYMRIAMEEAAKKDQRMAEYASRKRVTSANELIAQLENELEDIPVGVGARHHEITRLFGKYHCKGLQGDDFYEVENPWLDYDDDWPGLVIWASKLT